MKFVQKLGILLMVGMLIIRGLIAIMFGGDVPWWIPLISVPTMFVGSVLFLTARVYILFKT